MSNLCGIYAKAPCYQCKDRKVGCHGTCQKYIDFQKKWKENRSRARKKYNRG